MNAKMAYFADVLLDISTLTDLYLHLCPTAMVNIHGRRCSHEDCDKQPTFGRKGQKVSRVHVFFFLYDTTWSSLAASVPLLCETYSDLIWPSQHPGFASLFWGVYTQGGSFWLALMVALATMRLCKCLRHERMAQQHPRRQPTGPLCLLVRAKVLSGVGVCDSYAIFFFLFFAS